MLVTPGAFATFSGGQETAPTVCLYTYELPYHLWANKYQQGDALVVSDVLQVSPRSWPPELKCRSRMHYFLADRRARLVDPHARAVLLDEAGFVTETSTANIALVRAAEGIVSPRPEKILPGISLKTLAELAEAVEIPFIYREVRPEELLMADEVMLASTSVCLLPVVRCDGQPVGSGKPGPLYRKLLAAWNQRVDVNLPRQAERFARRARR
ncbi:MAG: aminotransferase class IV [Pirellulales bacterium]